MVKHTQTIRRLLAANCLNVFDHFLGLASKGRSILIFIFISDSLSTGLKLMACNFTLGKYQLYQETQN